jgi:hypothetical protein
MEKGVRVGRGNLNGKGVYAARNFEAGETVIEYNLQLITEAEYALLPEVERCFVHRHGDRLYLYGEPERYVNCAPDPNTCQDLGRERDYALRKILAGDAITTDPKRDESAR